MTPSTVTHQAPLSREFSMQEDCNAKPFPSPRDLPNPGIELGSPALQVDSLPLELSGKPEHYNKLSTSFSPFCLLLIPSFSTFSAQKFNCSSLISGENQIEHKLKYETIFSLAFLVLSPTNINMQPCCIIVHVLLETILSLN